MTLPLHREEPAQQQRFYFIIIRAGIFSIVTAAFANYCAIALYAASVVTT